MVLEGIHNRAGGLSPCLILLVSRWWWLMETESMITEGVTEKPEAIHVD